MTKMMASQPSLNVNASVDKSLMELREAVNKAEQSVDRARNTNRQVQQLIQQIKQMLDEAEQVRGAARDAQLVPVEVRQLVEKDRLLQWLKWQQLIRGLDTQAREAIQKNEVSQIHEHFLRLKEVNDSLSRSRCLNLRAFGLDCMTSLRNLAAIKLSEKLNKDLEALNFPLCVLSDEVSVGKLTLERETDISRFKANFLLMTDLFGSKSVSPTDKSSARPGQLMLEPLRKRFLYHFCGNRKTNNVVRPEWFLQQVKLWLRNSDRFFNQCRITDGSRLVRADVLDEILIIREGLLKLATNKLREDLETTGMKQDDLLLSHMIDEVLLFTREAVIVEMSRGLKAECLPISVLSSDTVFQRWLTLERKYAFEKMDALLLEEDGWQSCAASPELLRCVDAFVTLLQSLVARFKPVTEACIKLRFVALLFDLLEDFRLRLVKVMREQQEGGLVSSHTFALALNSALHLADTLESWQEMPLFLHLVYLLREDSDGLTDGDSSRLLFAHFIDAFNFMVRESTDQAAEIILYEVKAQSLSYRRHVSWSENIKCGDGGDECLLDEPSPEFLGMLQSLATNLTSFCQRLKPQLVVQVVERVSWLLSEFLLKEVILANDLSPAGTLRLQKDVRVGVRPILSQFGPAAPTHITRLQEAMGLLSTPAASALLLLEALRETVDVAEARDILREHGVRQLSGSMAEAVLARRTDVADLRRDV